MNKDFKNKFVHNQKDFFHKTLWPFSKTFEVNSGQSMLQGQCLLWPVDSLNRTSMNGIEDSDYGSWGPEKHPTRGKDRHSQFTMNLLMFCWNVLECIHVYLFMSVTSFASLVIFLLSSSTESYVEQFFVLFLYFKLFLGSLSPAIMMTRCLYPPY